jgi:cell division protein FtsB
MEGSNTTLRERAERSTKNAPFGQPPIRKEEPDGFSRFLWWLATVDPEVMRDCGPEKERYRIIGMSVLVTWLFATLAWGYFFSTVIDDELVVGGLAIFFGLAILAIDRNLIAAMGKSGSWLPVVFRLALAVTIGLFLSQPIVLMLFQKDIQSQIALNKEKKLETFRGQLASLNAPLVADYQGHIKTLRQQEATGADQVRFLKDGYIKETDGTGGSGKIGEAAVAKVKRAEYLKSQDAQDQLVRQDDPQIAAYQAKLDTLEAENKRKEQVYAANLSDGFLSQVEALSDLLKEHAPLRTRYQLIILIITLIEVMPVLSKLLLPKGEYEAKVAQAAEMGVYRAGLASERDKELEAYYAEQSLAADKASVDQFFEGSRTTRERMGRDVVQGSEGQSYSQLWRKFRRQVLSSRSASK